VVIADELRETRMELEETRATAQRLQAMETSLRAEHAQELQRLRADHGKATTLATQLANKENELETAQEQIRTLHAELSCQWNFVRNQITERRSKSRTPDGSDQKEKSPEPVATAEEWDKWAAVAEAETNARDIFHAALLRKNELVGVMDCIQTIQDIERSFRELDTEPSQRIRDMIAELGGVRETLLRQLEVSPANVLRELAGVLRQIIAGDLTMGEDEGGEGYTSFEALISSPTARNLALWKKTAQVKKRPRESAGRAGSPRHKTRAEPAAAKTA
jgi:hypothetical protein